MKYFLAIIVLIFSFLINSCSNNKKEQQKESIKCLPACVLIVPLGRNDKPKEPLIIKTNKEDTSYFRFMGGRKEDLEQNGFLISKENANINIIGIESYFLLKHYIVTHNTHKDRTVFNANANTMKIILVDRCDSLAYAVDKEEKEYFSKMIDTLNLKNEDELRGYINYYHQIQERDGSK